MQITAIKTRKFLPPKDDLWELLSSSIKSLSENTVVVVTSKIVAIADGRCVPVDQYENRDDLAIQEANKYLPRKFVPGEWFLFTIKNNLLIASAGIDKSNANGFYILWPKDAQSSAKKIWHFLRKKYKVKNLGVLITDSHTQPSRRGLLGFALGYYGFVPLRDYRGKRDIFGKELVVSQTNIPDSLAAAAVFTMGEGNEQTPVVLIRNLPKSVKFIQGDHKPEGEFDSFEVPPQTDLYSPFFKSVPWRPGGGGKKLT